MLTTCLQSLHDRGMAITRQQSNPQPLTTETVNEKYLQEIVNAVSQSWRSVTKLLHRGDIRHFMI